MRGLAPEFEGRVVAHVRSATSDEGAAAPGLYGWEKPHGLVALAPDGTVVANRAGHSYGEAEVRAAFEKAAAAAR